MSRDARLPSCFSPANESVRRMAHFICEVGDVKGLACCTEASWERLLPSGCVREANVLRDTVGFPGSRSCDCG